jgi:glycine cleavage system H protein
VTARQSAAQEHLVTNFPEDLKYTAEHEWVRSGNGSRVRVGVTDYAAEQLGDIVYVSLPEVGDTVGAGDACGELESTKSVSDLFSPVPGVVSAVNEQLASTPTRTATAGSSSSTSTRGRTSRACWTRTPTPRRWGRDGRCPRRKGLNSASHLAGCEV